MASETAMQYFARTGWLAAALALTACASTPAVERTSAPDFSEIAPMAAPARAVLYTDCLAQAISRPAVARLSREGIELLRFTCTGAPALRFYEALAVPGEEAMTTWQSGGRTYRATTLIRTDLFGADYCSVGASNDAVCQIVLNTGPFLTAGP
jgi:hypothetical protein